MGGDLGVFVSPPPSFIGGGGVLGTPRSINGGGDFLGPPPFINGVFWGGGH